MSAHGMPVLVAATFAVVLGASSAPALALPEDRNQPIYIKSDRAERDERQGTTTYTGDVVIDQGTMHITADRVVITMDGDRVSRMHATGRPARMNQKTSPEKEPIYARGLDIEYDVVKDVLTLTRQAEVTQEGSTVTGERIEYFVQEQRVKATADGNASGDSRVQMVIQPKHVAPASGKPAATPPQPQPQPDPSAQPPGTSSQEDANGAP